jgi:phage tail sheath protein FI
MATPGVLVKSGASAGSSSPPVDIGQWFIAGLAEKGSIDRAVKIRSLAQYVTTFGARVAYGSLYDSLDLFFSKGDGGSVAYVARVVGPTPVTATVTIKDGSVNTMVFNASSPGEWGNELSVVVTHPTSETFKLVVKLGSTVVAENLTPFSTAAEAIAWAATTAFLRIETLGHGIPEVATKTLASGADDRSNVTETQWTNARKLFTKDLGPGQVSMPGRTTAEAQEGLLTHCEQTNRIALLDGTDTATVGTLTSQATTLRGQTTARYGGLFAPWVVIPGISPGTTRTVPPCALVAGLMARNDGLGLNPNEPAAGDNGISSYAVGLSQMNWTDAQRGELSDSGVNAVRFMNENVEVYDDRTLVNFVTDDTWQWLSNARLDAFIKAKAAAVGERFIFRQIGKKVPAEFGSAIEGEVLLPLFNVEALYGDTQAEAFSVDTGEAVNTPESIEEGKLRAIASIRMSGVAQVIEIEIVKEAI